LAFGALAAVLDAHSFWACGRSRHDLRACWGAAATVGECLAVEGDCSALAEPPAMGVFPSCALGSWWWPRASQVRAGPPVKFVEELLHATRRFQAGERILPDGRQGAWFYERLGFKLLATPKPCFGARPIG